MNLYQEMTRLVVARSLVSPQSGYGVFTLDDIAKGQRLAMYVGRIIRHNDVEAYEGCYVMKLRGGLLLDAEDMGANVLQECGKMGTSRLLNVVIHNPADPNVSRFLNHSSMGNCIVNNDGVLISKKSLVAGEELLYNYNLGKRSTRLLGTSRTVPKRLQGPLSLTKPVNTYHGDVIVQHHRRLEIKRIPRRLGTWTNAPMTRAPSPHHLATKSTSIILNAVNDCMQAAVLTPKDLETQNQRGLRTTVAHRLRALGFDMTITRIAWKNEDVDTDFAPDINGRYVYIGYIRHKKRSRIHACALHHGFWIDTLREKALDIRPAKVDCPPPYFYAFEVWTIVKPSTTVPIHTSNNKG